VICVTVATATATGVILSDQLFEQLPINAVIVIEAEVLAKSW
jgi:hypothetical protein